MFNNKAHEETMKDPTRDKITNGTTRREECDNAETCEFLKLAKQPRTQQLDINNSIDEKDFTTVVRSAKRHSCSSMFSKRDYSVHKCAIKSPRMLKLLVKFYNIIL